LNTVQADDPMLRPPHRRTGKGAEGRSQELRRPRRKGDNSGDNAAETPEISPDLHDSPPHAPPAGTHWQKGQPHRWDAVRTPNQNYKVMVKLAHTYMDDLLKPDAAQLGEGEIIEGFKRRVANVLPGQMQNTGQILTALDSAAYRRRMLGMPVPANAGTNGQQAFQLHRHQHRSGHAN
jgi:hypothetical protein